jgi:hypothetical protein
MMYLFVVQLILFGHPSDPKAHFEIQSTILSRMVYVKLFKCEHSMIGKLNIRYFKNQKVWFSLFKSSKYIQKSKQTLHGWIDSTPSFSSRKQFEFQQGAEIGCLCWSIEWQSCGLFTSRFEERKCDWLIC